MEVEMCTLGSICEIKLGERIPKENLSDNGTIPVIGGGVSPLGYATKANSSGNQITISQQGTAGYVSWQSDPFWSSHHCYTILPSSKINSKYLFYVLKAKQEHLYYLVTPSPIPRLLSNVLSRVLIPVPPLEVQQEIVSILDCFSELERELERRKIQYTYYRDLLLTPKPIQTKMMKLKDVLTIKNGSDYKKFGNGNIPVYGSGGIITYIDRSIFDKPSVLIPRKGSLDKLYYIDTPFWNVDTIFYTEINTSIVHPKYIYYCLQSKQLEQLNKAGGVPSLTQAILNKLTIPVPPSEIQQRIVAILDKFSSLNDELDKKQDHKGQQKEYYMKELLNFEN